MSIAADRLRELLDYNPATGIFTRKVAVGRHGCFPVGSVAGARRDGYVSLDVDGKRYQAHRLAWLYMTGEWPADQIDHIDTDRSNNRFANLREATNAQNSQNEQRARRNSKTGLQGVSPNGNGWAAMIKVNGRTTFLGQFNSPELAHETYLKAKAQMHPFAVVAP